MAKKMLDLMHLSIVFFASGNLITMFIPVKTIDDWHMPKFYDNLSFYLALFGIFLF